MSVLSSLLGSNARSKPQAHGNCRACVLAHCTTLNCTLVVLLNLKVQQAQLPGRLEPVQQHSAASSMLTMWQCSLTRGRRGGDEVSHPPPEAMKVRKAAKGS